MNRKYAWVGLGWLLITLCGCQTILAPLGLQKSSKAYIEQARKDESRGDLVAALEQYKRAQTIDPNQPQVNDRIKSLEKKLDELAEAHYQAGVRFRDKGKWGLAKKEFLEALRYRPDYKNAAAMLKERQPSETRTFIIHKIAPGESISKLALKFYGDYKKYYHIANFNNLSNAAQVRVGQRIMIPVIKGVSLDDLKRIESSSKTQPPPEKMASAPAPAPEMPSPAETMQPAPVGKPAEKPPEPSASQPAPSGPEDQVAAYRQTGIALFKEKNYAEAIVELQKVVDAVPDDAEAGSYIARAYVQMGKADLADNRLAEAKTAFATALKYDKHCSECRKLLDRSRTIEAAGLRKKGETLFKNNQFEKAIATLDRAVALNPDDAAAKDLLFQAYFQNALKLYDKQDYLAASGAFQKAAAIKPDCSQCKQYIEDSNQAYKDFYYNQGIIYFGQEKLKEAIIAWKKVAAVDPNYKDVQQNLKKATLLNNRLERIRKSNAK
jgi:tetratricopeptide (TPR) repeat protein